MGNQRPAKRRARGLVACERCKARKQRCDNEFPSCSNCVSAGQDCLYGSKQVYPAEYVRSLEQYATELEKSVAMSPTTTPGIEALSQGRPRLKRQNRAGDDGPDDSHEEVSQLGEAEQETASNIELGTGIVAPSPDSFLGTSSGLPLAKLLRAAVETSDDPSQIGQAVSQNIACLGTPLMPRLGPTPPVHGEPLQKRAAGHKDQIPDMPKSEVGEKLIDAYYARVHPKHPFLPRKRIAALHQNRDGLRPAFQLEKSEVIKGDSCNYAILRLVYAIGARYLQLSNDGDYPSPTEHYMAALADADVIFAVRSLESLDAMLLLTIYQLRSPTGPGVWWMVGTTMRHCLDCGLHRQTMASNTSSLLDQRRKRIFWTAYMLERSVARTMGRPYAVSDRDIDVDLPANIDDDLDTEDDVRAAIVQSETNPMSITTLSPAIHIFRLQQIESRIQHTVCRVDRPVSSIKPDKIASLRNALEAWRLNIPVDISQQHQVDKSHPYLTRDYYMTQYHKAIVLIILPFLPSLAPESPDFRQVAYSAGQICQLSKSLHKKQTYISFSLLSLHANFIGGLVMVYCFCKDPTMFNPRFSSDIRACSTMLYTISERWPLARKVRNAFDRLVDATVERQFFPMARGPNDTNQGLGLLASVAGQSGLGHGDPMLGSGAGDDVWDSFEAVLGSYQINTETWMQDSIFEAMDAFPSFD